MYQLIYKGFAFFKKKQKNDFVKIHKIYRDIITH